jgi:L-serine dehydratase
MTEKFYSVSDLFEVFSGKRNFSASEVAHAVLRYQRGLKCAAEEEVKEEMLKNQIKPMEESRENAWKDPGAKKVRELVKCEKIRDWHNSQNGTSIWNILPHVMADAIAISSFNAAMGKIVAAPTAGSCGILPAAILNVRDYLVEQSQLTHEERDNMMVDAMLVAGGIGVLIAEKATLSGAEGGCQAECGAAAAMAAGAIVTLHKGRDRNISNAAALALKNSLGLTCDPVKGFVLVPCIKRNAFYAVHAILAAEMAMIGIESTIPLVQVIEAMNETGQSMSADFRETAKGGLAVTKEAEKLGHVFEEKLG